MIVLSIETAGPRGGVAIVASGTLKAQETFDTHGQLGARLTPAVRRVMKAAGLSNDVPPDMIAVDIGPGSYTGIRVGLAAAKGLAFGWRRPVVGVSSLNALATLAPASAQKVACVIDARKGEVYGAIFERQQTPKHPSGQLWRMTYSPGIIAPVKLVEQFGEGPVTLIGDAAQLVAMATPKTVEAEVLDEKSWPTAETIAQLGHSTYQEGRLDDTLSLTPVYMRPTAPEQARGRKRRRSRTKI